MGRRSQVSLCNFITPLPSEKPFVTALNSGSPRNKATLVGNSPTGSRDCTAHAFRYEHNGCRRISMQISVHPSHSDLGPFGRLGHVLGQSMGDLEDIRPVLCHVIHHRGATECASSSLCDQRCSFTHVGDPISHVRGRGSTTLSACKTTNCFGNDSQQAPSTVPRIARFK